MTDNIIHIVGGGMAGCEAAWAAANAGCQVILHEMRPIRGTDAHKTDGLAELVCSNSFRSDDAETNAVGVLHAEMRLAGSLIMSAGDAHKLPAGGALAVDRDGFSHEVTGRIEAHPNIELCREEVDGEQLKVWGNAVIATGPLTSEPLAEAIRSITGDDGLAFFDAIAPIIYRDSIDFDIVWFQSRYDKPGPGGTGADYINCPLNEDQYRTFIQALIDSDKTDFKEWEASTPYFNGCLPIEVMAERGPETLRFGPMKPRGLTNKHQPDIKPYAVVQLRQDNALGTLYNMVGFQTKMKYASQAELFRTIPGLENAQFARLGGLHRNTFLNSPKLLDEQLRLTAMPNLRFAGQITGVEGYVESAAIGLIAGRLAAAQVAGTSMTMPPATTGHGALINHITGGHIETTENASRSFQPMNVNFGLFPPVETPKTVDGKRLRGKDKSVARKRAYSARALADFGNWLSGQSAIAAE
ncbi:MAG: methylenetetrahydrofolate--tRNA-(uracil(54)-C(5))-methyltransferase (FADH(2)-oxidizing) TrmFO [Hyphomicrobiales bacterium]|nr:methylenetetrahydrofolate--tRNA-(uracil(54)-C(5))-methyltransferase (FADH(2)-oxidizing) TrmFO [Hyphomicrobiales bacterium]